jgi:hypothetical protein
MAIELIILVEPRNSTILRDGQLQFKNCMSVKTKLNPKTFVLFL